MQTTVLRGVISFNTVTVFYKSRVKIALYCYRPQSTCSPFRDWGFEFQDDAGSTPIGAGTGGGGFIDDEVINPVINMNLFSISGDLSIERA